MGAANDPVVIASRSEKTKKRTRIQARNRERIIAAALDVFASNGYAGTTLDQIAAGADMSKPNLLYYFSGKQSIYAAVLEQTVDIWLEPFAAMDPDGDPFEEISRYIKTKLELSRKYPAASRIYANEILDGAPVILENLSGSLKELVDKKATVVAEWAKQKKIYPINAHHLFFMIWSTTQHYADFEVQVRAVLGKNISSDHLWDDAADTVLAIFMRGLRPD